MFAKNRYFLPDGRIFKVNASKFPMSLKFDENSEHAALSS